MGMSKEVRKKMSLRRFPGEYTFFSGKRIDKGIPNIAKINRILST